MNIAKSTPEYLSTLASKAARLSLVACALMISVFTQTAHAQWQVTDRDVTQNTKDTAANTKDTAKYTNQIQKDLKEDLKLGSYSSPGDRVADPLQYPLAQSTSLQQDIADCGRLAKEQQAGCQEIAKTEDAQSQYMKTMYLNTEKRHDRLKKILDERNNISGSHLGQLEDNTNKLVALYDLMAIDRQQMESVNYAYETRLRYLRARQTRLAQAAASGQTPGSTSILGVDLGQIATAVTTGATLKLALEGVQSSTPAGMRTLRTEQSSGYGL